MLRRKMRIGDELHVGDHIVIFEGLSKTTQIQVVVIPKTEPYVLRRAGKSARVGHPDEQSTVTTPYHPDVETMLKS